MQLTSFMYMTTCTCTVEPLNNEGHIGANRFVLCREVVPALFRGSKCIDGSKGKLTFDVSFVEMLFLLCPLLRGSFIGVSFHCNLFRFTINYIPYT